MQVEVFCIQEQVEQVKHSTVLQLRDLSLCDICVLGNLFIFCDLNVHVLTLTLAITNLTFWLLVVQLLNDPYYYHLKVLKDIKNN